MNARTCRCCGGKLEPSQRLLCLTCILGDPPPDQDRDSYPEDDWKEQVRSDDEVLRRNGAL
jgi:hypothetical protein